MPLGLRGKKTKCKAEKAGADDERVPGPPSPARRLVFHTQLAHGSATGRVEDFTSIQELYAKIASVFEISPSEVRQGGQPPPPSGWWSSSPRPPFTPSLAG
jgi:hypothetical protein